MLFKLTRWYFKCITVQKLTSINKTGLGQRFSKCGPWTSNGIRIARGLIRNAKSQNQTQTYWVSRSEGGAQETMIQYPSGDSDVRFVWGPLVNGQSKSFCANKLVMQMEDGKQILDENELFLGYSSRRFAEDQQREQMHAWLRPNFHDWPRDKMCICLLWN